ncbi:MAG: rhamnulokinase family protein [Leifsonia sp.]
MTGDRSTGGTVAAVDLGATSGRVVLGHVGGGELRMRAIARFPNGPVDAADGLHWDVTGLSEAAIAGLAAAVHDEPGLASVGIDSWAVDYALLRDGRMLAEPFHYRDDRTAAGVEATHRIAPFDALYARNGLQFLPFNTLYQLAAEHRLADADTLLLVPDLLAFQLTGIPLTERTNASTTGLVDVRTGDWDDDLIARLGLPASVFTPLIDSGTRIGAVSAATAARIGSPIDVIAVGSHDTASAVVAVPMRAESAAYISCGTWGLVGVELEHPVLTEAAREANFTNEGGVDGRVRFLHNVMGLWLLSESVRTWERGGESIDLPALLAQAAAVTDAVPVFDANDPRFLSPGDMPERIAAWFGERAIPAPTSRAAIARSIIESLAQAFADAVRTASVLSGVDVETIHIVGGGALNELLCQRTADRAGIPVLAGPVEATAIGNILVQARTNGFAAGSLEDLRAVVARSFEPRRYLPR